MPYDDDMNAPQSQVASTKVSAEVIRMLDARAKKLNVSRGEVMRRALVAWLRYEKDQFEKRLAEAMMMTKGGLL